MMESPKLVSMARGTDATSATVDQLCNAIEQMQFQQNYSKLTVVKPNWYGVAHCGGRQKVLIEKLRSADERLQSIIADGRLHTNWDQYNAVRMEIKEIFAELLRHEMKFCRQNNVEQYFWKLLYHNMIESARRFASDKSNNNAASFTDSYRQLCLHLISDGMELFQDILRLLTQTYGFQLEQYMGVEGGKNLKGLKYISLAVVSAQKCCICLGDLLRYQALVNESAKFEAASEWYTKAYQLIPSNGMPSNQLAILALYNKKKFDAIFYHMRSLNASNPIKSAKESLVILFDELRKKYQLLYKVSSQSIGQNGDGNAKRVKMKNFKREIWVHPTDGQINYRTVFLDQETESLDSVDLYKKFIFNFSHLHGILFTKVGSDSLEICMEQTLKQLQELLDHSMLTSCFFTLQKIAQMIILNIYSIENSMQLSSPSHSPTPTQSSSPWVSSSSQPQSALVFSFAFIGIILNKLQCEMDDMLATTDTDDTTYESKYRINEEMHFNVRQINKFKLSDSINNSLAAISLWCNWLKFNWSAWTSDAILVAVHKFGKAYDIRVWDDFARLTMALDKFNFEIDDQLLVRSEPLLQPNNTESLYKRIRLIEDMITLGMPSVIRNDFVYCKSDIDEQCASTVLRWKNIYDFCTTELMKEGCSFLCRLDFGEVVVAQLFTATDESGSRDKSNFGISEDERDTAENPSNDSQNTKPSADVEKSANGGDGDAGDKHLVSIQETNEHQSSGSSDEIQRLLQRKSELEQTHKMQERLTKFNQDILRQTNSETICLEIRPKYLLPDTNCFIDFLPDIKQLAQVYPLYHLIVPIVVLNELEGLAKGESGKKIYDTPTKTSLNAHKALVFLKATGSNVKCATSKGSFLNSMAFTKETDCINAPKTPIDHLNNDDKILMTAINLTKQYSNDPIIGTKLISISNLQRKVVLLTNDRNLKLKAITQNIPVRELDDFIKWSGITK